MGNFSKNNHVNKAWRSHKPTSTAGKILIESVPKTDRNSLGRGSIEIDVETVGYGRVAPDSDKAEGKGEINGIMRADICILFKDVVTMVGKNRAPTKKWDACTIACLGCACNVPETSFSSEPWVCCNKFEELVT